MTDGSMWRKISTLRYWESIQSCTEAREADRLAASTVVTVATSQILETMLDKARGSAEREKLLNQVHSISCQR